MDRKSLLTGLVNMAKCIPARPYKCLMTLYFWKSCLIPLIFRDTIDAVKQSAALTLLRLLRNSPDVIQMGEWTSRIIHLLNDQHMVRTNVYLVSFLTHISH